eukprot:20732-Eustigmatos_ZCMA.PRE.1
MYKEERGGQPLRAAGQGDSPLRSSDVGHPVLCLGAVQDKPSLPQKFKGEKEGLQFGPNRLLAFSVVEK